MLIPWVFLSFPFRGLKPFWFPFSFLLLLFLILSVQEYFPSVLALFCVPGCAFGCALVFLPPKDIFGFRSALSVEIAGGLTTLARLKAQLSQGTSSGGTSSTPNSRPTDDTRVVAEDLVLTEGGTDGSGRGVEADDDVVVLSPEGASRKRKRSEDVDSENMVEGDGAVPSVVDRRFDAPAFIDEYLMPGTEDFFRECDVTF
ncbi:uncharacterized protein LOC110271047 [Arachis ipaensis]|uniref:uncharacterized protein LOC110271047 n=1 Tax=Arachis ipaensis TaxID=130454 RepID=UPI000A2B46B3|nr:uncharacterized protein LOC110271047 [Arachis ipaensis]XP_025647019.1 uncharacterized protein LOC112742020 [Arachis hypogaea]